jgi:hypothetical protein
VGVTPLVRKKDRKYQNRRSESWMNEQAEKQDGSGEDVVQGKRFFILNLLQVDRMMLLLQVWSGDPKRTRKWSHSITCM